VNARQVDEASTRLRDLRIQSFEELLVALLATGLALAATQFRPVLALPLLLGAIGVGFLGIRALVRRTFLVEELSADRDAYAIPEVRRYGLRAAELSHRRLLARSIRVALAESTLDVAAHLRGARAELDRLAAVLEDERFDLPPYEVVNLEHWLADPYGSFRNPAVPVPELRSRLRCILASFDERPPR
jgi:hypothetical protein